ncbi:MAG: DUF4391 domain-containing protein [Succinivibrionaceae bacterium]|nr:DUF4391 domain-containing protein [Succinivibrionaceae bacterium]
MIDLPKATLVRRRLPKETVYRNLVLTSAVKEKFVSDVEAIFIENSLTAANLNLGESSGVEEILVVLVKLKTGKCDDRILEVLARENPHKLVFLLEHENLRQLALYYGRLYKTDWMNESEIQLNARGLTLEQIYEGFVEQIALGNEQATNVEHLSIAQRLKLQDRIVKLQAEIRKLENETWKEPQPRRKYEKFEKVKKMSEEVEKLKRGEI